MFEEAINGRDPQLGEQLLAFASSASPADPLGCQNRAHDLWSNLKRSLANLTKQNID